MRGKKLTESSGTSSSIRLDYCYWLSFIRRLFRIVTERRSKGIQGFAASLGGGTNIWLMNYRRLNRNHEFWPETSEAVVKIAMIHIMLRKLA